MNLKECCKEKEGMIKYFYKEEKSVSWDGNE